MRTRMQREIIEMSTIHISRMIRPHPTFQPTHFLSTQPRGTDLASTIMLDLSSPLPNDGCQARIRQRSDSECRHSQQKAWV